MSIPEIELPNRRTRPDFPPVERPGRERRLRSLKKSLETKRGKHSFTERPFSAARWRRLVNGMGKDGPPNRPTAVGGGEEERYDVIAEANQIVINSGFSIETHKN